MMKCAHWYFALKKRLLKKLGFGLLLLCIPVLTLFFTLSAENEESGFLRIALGAESPNDPLAQQMMERLKAESKVLLFTIHPDAESAKEQVYTGKADAAWIFAEDLKETLVEFAQSGRGTPVTAYESGDRLVLTLAHEKIYGVLLHEITYAMYTDYVSDEFSASYTEEELQEIYEQTAIDGELIRFEFADTDRTVEELNYLTSPLRGLLAVVMVLCGMASTMYFLTDEQNGTFAWLSAPKRFWVLWGENLAAISLAGAVTTVALQLSGTEGGLGEELLLMLVYVFAAAGFCTVLGSLVKNLKLFAVLFPIVTVTTCLFAPIFSNGKDLPMLRQLFPAYHYLYAMDDPAFFGSLLIYIPLALAVGYGLYRITRRNI
ncbi:MAG: ABC transporter permease [Clostridia bacterium]|nr:ABC transporter permease [Clostridia bacterium]